MEFGTFVDRLRAGEDPKFPAEAKTVEWAETLDSQDPLKHLRDEFILPTKGSLKKRALTGSIPGDGRVNGSAGDSGDDHITSTYFIGNSLGPQPKAVRRHIDAQLETWASLGCSGHFTDLENSPLVQWQDMAADCAARSADLVGASADEIVIMNTITVNLHMLMASFYRPSGRRHKVILEWKPFPSDFYAIESQVRWHGLEPGQSMVLLQPDGNHYLSTAAILAAIDEHADETALLLLPGIQYYTGQLFDIPTITKHAQARGIPYVGWDCAHAAGNVELRLHDWNVDFAVWCTYKYINAGPGAIAGAFVHERHGAVERRAATTAEGSPSSQSLHFRPRLAGWYGGDKSVRFNMDNVFQPTPGAAGFQVSNPSAVDLASLTAALSVFQKTSMRDLRSKALVLTAYAQFLLDAMMMIPVVVAVSGDVHAAEGEQAQPPPFRVITPRDPRQRGTQLSILVRADLMDSVAEALKRNGVACDQRKPNVIRCAPAPLYTRFRDVYDYMAVLREALGL
ncbi:pyridoxal phosphate-dependent transferase [Xylariomycetidae sp. FL2044]|nr:pyridoxal phosphate-dependent transferase [Xylariomycetidae sp. FL2044]